VVVGAKLEDRGDAGERQRAHEGEHEQGFVMARSRAWKAPTKVRSSVVPRPRMIVWAQSPNTPAVSPIVRVAGSRVRACQDRRLIAGLRGSAGPSGSRRRWLR
jgi:hypothetical protein